MDSVLDAIDNTAASAYASVSDFFYPPSLNERVKAETRKLTGEVRKTERELKDYERKKSAAINELVKATRAQNKVLIERHSKMAAMYGAAMKQCSDTIMMIEAAKLELERSRTDEQVSMVVARVAQMFSAANARMPPERFRANMAEYEKNREKLADRRELVQESMSETLNGDGDDGQTAEEAQKIADEVALEVSRRMPTTSARPMPRSAAMAADPVDAALESRLHSLKK